MTILTRGQTWHFTTAATRGRRAALCLGLCLALSWVPAWADAAPVWRLQDAQGHTVFTDRVSEDDIASGRARPLALDPVTPAMAAEAAARRRREQAEIEGYDRQLNQKLQRRSDAARATEAALLRLQQAQANYQAGEAPREDERQATRHGSRILEARYARRRTWERQQVEQAALALEQARAYHASLP